MLLSRALEIAEQYKSTLESACSRIEIVGSVKRGGKPPEDSPPPFWDESQEPAAYHARSNPV